AQEKRLGNQGRLAAQARPWRARPLWRWASLEVEKEPGQLNMGIAKAVDDRDAVPLEDLAGLSRRAGDEGWHGPVIDQIHDRAARRLQYLREELKR
ncbi:MAG: hypothetical protein WBM00_01985, partial [Solirubrobacterales bacterium]